MLMPEQQGVGCGRCVCVGGIPGRGPRGVEWCQSWAPRVPTGATQAQRSRGISSFRDCGEEVPPASAELEGEAGWEHVAEAQRSGWGFLLPSPWQPHSGTDIAQLCSGREKVGRLSGDEP